MCAECIAAVAAVDVITFWLMQKFLSKDWTRLLEEFLGRKQQRRSKSKCKNRLLLLLFHWDFTSPFLQIDDKFRFGMLFAFAVRFSELSNLSWLPFPLFFLHNLSTYAWMMIWCRKTKLPSNSSSRILMSFVLISQIYCTILSCLCCWNINLYQPHIICLVLGQIIAARAFKFCHLSCWTIRDLPCNRYAHRNPWEITSY